MFLIGLARLGRDCELRFLSDQTAVTNLSLAYNWGKKDAQGNRATQWVDGSLFGDKAQKLVQYLTKGTLLEVHLSDVHIEEFTKSDGSKGTKIAARVAHLEFAGGGQQQGQQGAQQQRGDQNAYARETGRASGNAGAQQQRRQEFDGDAFEDPIPF